LEGISQSSGSPCIDEVLANWPNGARGILITTRSTRCATPILKIGSVIFTRRAGTPFRMDGNCKCARIRSQARAELREAFIGAGVPSYESKDFTGVAHFYLGRLSEAHWTTSSFSALKSVRCY